MYSNPYSKPYFSTLALVFVAVVSGLAGCQSNLSYKKLAAKNPMSKNAQKTPTQMVDVWNNYAQTSPDGQVLRGVAGRVHFYNDAKKKRAIKVDGNLTVFIFDGKEGDPSRSKPLRIYKFPAETLQSHHAFKKPLGHGYDFFLPFDEINGEEKNLCIMARFDDQLEGTMLVAKPVNTILKGSKKPTPETSFQEYLANNSILGKTERNGDSKPKSSGDSSPEKEIRQVVFNEAETSAKTAAAPEQAKPQRNVATISLNDDMARRLALSTEQKETASSSESPTP